MAALTDAELVGIIQQNSGWRGADLVDAFAIAKRESHGDPTAHNAKPPDNSYGLFQLNLIGSLISRLKTWGLSTPEQLYDPATNVRAAYATWQGSGWQPWNLAGDPLRNTDLPAARAAVTASGAYPGPALTPAQLAAAGAAAVAWGNPVAGTTFLDRAGGAVTAPLLGALGVAGSAVDAITSPLEFLRGLPDLATRLAVFVLVAGAGVAILVLGAWRTVAPARQAVEQRAQQGATVAAVA